MEELQNLIKQRFERVSEVTRGTVTPDRFKILKEEEKGRCEKQNFVVSMMRANKATQIISKTLYFNVSYHMMRQINPDFQHELNIERLEENFLNDFVGLYRHFFSKYEQMFNFKVKLQNLIRPTNHNLIIDLVRYLVDFSRDYYQQTFFWYMKANNKVGKIEEEENKDQEESSKEEESEPILKKKIGRASLNEMVLQRELTKRDKDEFEVRRDPQKSYSDVLDILGFPPLSSQPKDGSTNIQVLKFRINQIYRDMKSRNQMTKTNLNSYYFRYFGENDQKQKQYIEDEQNTINKATYPFKLVLNIEKSGFNYISVSYSDQRTFNKSKDTKLSPLKVSQRLMPAFQKQKNEYMLTSLKVLRISDSFLPPLINQNQNFSLPVTPSKEKILKDFQCENASRINLMSSSSAANQEELDRKKKKFSQQAGDTTQYRPEAKIVKQLSFRKLNELKRGFKSEEKREGGILLNSNNANTTNPSDPEKKIYDWLDKLRQVKEIERKKIMGL